MSSEQRQGEDFRPKIAKTLEQRKVEALERLAGSIHLVALFLFLISLYLLYSILFHK